MIWIIIKKFFNKMIHKKTLYSFNKNYQNNFHLFLGIGWLENAIHLESLVADGRCCFSVVVVFVCDIQLIFRSVLSDKLIGNTTLNS